MKNVWDKRVLSIVIVMAMIISGVTCVPVIANAEGEASADIADNGTNSLDVIYRLYNVNSGEHFYTESSIESDILMNAGWNAEGIAWTEPVAFDTPVYRLFNPYSGDHHYTIDANERDYLVSVGWNDEKIGWYSSDNGIPVYRLYNPYAMGAGSHLFTADAVEKEMLIGFGWNYEGIGWYGKSKNLSYKEFKELSNEEQIETFNKMSGEQIYALVAESDESWPVTDYDLITPENAKETIVLYNNNGNLHFNLAWPCYGGFTPESIASIGELKGKLDVSRDGGDGGYSMSYGRNADGSYPNDSQRSVPKTSATVRTGTLDVDRYNEIAKIVTNGESEESRLSKLVDMGYTKEISEKFIQDQASWLNRDEVSGPNNIDDGAKSVGKDVDSRYGYDGITAPWITKGLFLTGGGGQLNTIFSWGTLCNSGLIYDTGTAEIH